MEIVCRAVIASEKKIGDQGTLLWFSNLILGCVLSKAFHKNKITLQTRANENCTLDFSSISSFQSSFVNTEIFQRKSWNSPQTDSFVVSFLRITGLFQFTWKIHWSSRDRGRTNAEVGFALTTVKQKKLRKHVKARFITFNGQNPTKLKALVVDTCSASCIYGRVLTP